MDIRTKLVFALVAAALGSMLILGAITYSNAERLLTESSLERLRGLADAKQERLESLISDWKDRASLVAGRPLRTSLRAYNRTRSADEVARIEEHLADALDAVPTFEGLAVYDAQGRRVTSAEREGGIWPAPATLSVSDPSPGPRLVDTRFTDDGRLFVSLVASLTIGGETLGSLHLALDGQGLLTVTQNLAGLGETGETLIAGRDADGEGVFLVPPARAESSDPVDIGDAARRVLTGVEGDFAGDMIDYTGEPIWAALRYLPEPEWGLVVKFDADEVRAPIDQFRRDQTQVGIVLAAFAILIGILLGLRFAKPIHDLAAVTTRIREGDLEARAGAKREDEIGMLGRTFNDMADELEQRMTALNEFKTFFDLSRDMLCIGGTDGTFKLLNPAFERTLGWTAEELVNRPYVDFIHPDDVDSTNREVEQLAQGIPTISFENRYRCADGTYKRLRWTAHPEPETGLLYAVARDITDRHRSED